ncbi:MAG: zf-HC2 domain-containing protein [Armatimonadota bacterium]
MQCKEVREKLYMYLDGESDRHEALAIQDHLSKCQECRNWEQSLSSIQTLVSESLHDDTRYPDLSTEIMSQLPINAKPARKPVWAFAIAAAVLLLIAVAGLIKQKPTPDLPAASHQLVHKKPIERKTIVEQPNAPKQSAVKEKLPYRQPPKMHFTKQKHFVHVHRSKNLTKRELVAEKNETKSTTSNQKMKIHIDIVPAECSCSNNTASMIAMVNIDGKITKLEYMPTRELNEPIPGAETIERPPLNDMWRSND